MGVMEGDRWFIYWTDGYKEEHPEKRVLFYMPLPTPPESSPIPSSK